MKFAPSKMELRSPAFESGGRIPAKHTGEGPDVSPALAWSDAPAATRAFALFCHDPDAPVLSGGGYGFVHWVLYNIPASVAQLAEGAKQFTSGRTDFGKQAYGGPMPPPGHGTHRYYFWILALNQDLALAPGLTLSQLLEKVEPHLLGMSRLVGTYSRA
jgi:Raf kinase inhibitor-like YbhB/YbcL family protein